MCEAEFEDIEKSIYVGIDNKTRYELEIESSII